MSFRRRLIAAARHRLGTVAHDVGVATQADFRAVRSDPGGLEELSTRLDALTRLVEEHDTKLRQAVQALDDLTRRTGDVESLQRIDSVSRWIKQAALRDRPLVSVILPTADRTERLRRAIESVLAQRYEHWELLVVDDGERETARAIVEAPDDPRIRWARSRRKGTSGTRNTGLELARGEIIAYLDDDNIMDPQWLFSVAWAFEQRPDADTLYGAFIVDDVLRIRGEAQGGLPHTFLAQWDREIILRQNIVDIGAVAHRSGLSEARFDEELSGVEDWDLLLRLTAQRDPMMLPVVACYYTTDAPDRKSNDPEHLVMVAKVASRASKLVSR